MRLAQEALNRARSELVQLSWQKVPHPPLAASYKPAAAHAKPSMAVSAALCEDAKDTAGDCIGFAPIRHMSPLVDRPIGSESIFDEILVMKNYS